MHRDMHGDKNDHELVGCTWMWCIRMNKCETCKDYDCLYKRTVDKQGNPTRNEYMVTFEKVIEDTLTELGYDSERNSATIVYSHMCSAIHHAVDTVLSTKRKSKASNAKSLRNRRGKGTKQQFKVVQSEIVKSSLSDFEAWVDEWLYYHIP